MSHNIPWGLLVIRFGLAGVLLWFGAQQILSPEDWVGYIPEMVTNLVDIPTAIFVLLNGTVEVVSGLLLLLGVFVRTVSVLMGLHLALIALSLGHNAIAVRDWGLAFAFFGLVLTGGGALTLERSSLKQQ
ncbi:MAG: DoxX family membrane protein [Patescibacteria group bacterium]